METPRLNPFTKAVVWLGVATGAIWLAAPVVPLRFLAETLFSCYGWTSLACLLQVRSVFSRTRPGRGRKGQVRPAWDATWYLPVYIWGIESNLNIVTIGAGDGPPWMVAPEQVVMLFVTLSLCLGTEGWARRRGAPSRAGLGAMPLPVVAAIVGVGLPWLLFSFPQGPM